MNIAIITGGVTGERETSKKSAENIKEQINFAEVNTYFFPEEEDLFFENVDMYDYIIPVIHGAGGEDGLLQKRLDSFGKKYLFSDHRGHNLSFDKDVCKKKLNKHGILSPKTFSFEEIDNSDLPVIYKEIDGGSSINVRIIYSMDELKNIKDFDHHLIEQYITGREFTVGVVDDVDGVSKALSVIEIMKDGPIFNKSQKYSENTEKFEVFPENLDIELENQLKEIALKVHKSLGLKHMSRSDFIVDNAGDIYFLEVNTIPGMTKKSLIIKELKKDGYELNNLLKYWCS